MVRYGRTLIIAALICAAGAGVWPRLWAESGQHKHYLHQAEAFLQGRLDIADAFGDVATYGGRHYVVFPPFPAVLITPLVAVFGQHTRTTLVALALTGLNVLVLRGILRRLGVDDGPRRWTLAAFFLGTAYTTSSFQTYETWHFAHVVAVTCLLLAVYETLGRGRGVLVGLACGLAFLSRHLCLCAAVFLAVLIWQRGRAGGGGPESAPPSADAAPAPPSPASRNGRRGAAVAVNLLGMGLALSACVGAYLYFNWLRFGHPFETGYQYLALEGFLAERVKQYGLFHPAYVPFNLTYMFLQGFHVTFAAPTYLSARGLDLFGTSITFASPFVFFALRARWPGAPGLAGGGAARPVLWAAWLALVLPLVHTAFYYNNGFAQTNAQRFTLDFLPVLILLVALGIQRSDPRWWKPAIAYSIALNAAALFLTSLLERLTAKL